ncbi:hypothetical protein QTP88_008602 [Uroleucon formosanum]
MKKLGARDPAAGYRGREAFIADALFPAAPVTDWGLAPSPAVHNIFQAFDPVLNTLEFTRVIPGFKPEELSRAVKRLAPGKAAGPSGIPNEILWAAALTQPCAVLRIFNDCLDALTFPPRWKRARLVLLRKGPDKPHDAPSSYRPICMLNTPGKLLERLLLQRLEDHLDAQGGLRRAPNQFGFRTGVSTESAIGKVTCGVPQGSVLDPALWNVTYDSLLKMDTPSGVQLVGFADDHAVVEMAVTGQQLKDAINPTLTAIDNWMRSRGLELSHQKNKAVILS